MDEMPAAEEFMNKIKPKQKKLKIAHSSGVQMLMVSISREQRE